MDSPEHRRIGGTSLGCGDKFHFKSYPLILILIQDKTSLCLLTSLTNFLIFRPCLVQNRERPIELANVGYCDKMSAFNKLTFWMRQATRNSQRFNAFRFLAFSASFCTFQCQIYIILILYMKKWFPDDVPCIQMRSVHIILLPLFHLQSR